MSEPSGTSWPVATWAVPAVPGVVLTVMVLVGAATGVGDGSQSLGYSLGLALAVVLVVLGQVLVRAAAGPGLRGLGAGLVAGGAATAVGWLAVMLS
jgi:hypothetical protein